MKSNKSKERQEAETYINKTIKGIDELTGKEVEGVCFGVDNQTKPMGKRGIFLCVKGPSVTITYKIDFFSLKK